MRLAAATHLGPYEIISALGAGGMGEVYRARDTRLGRDVALKVLPISKYDDPALVARFEREAQALAALNHPRIAAIYDVVDAGDHRAIVMELVTGSTLAEVIWLIRWPGGPARHQLADSEYLASSDSIGWMPDNRRLVVPGGGTTDWSPTGQWIAHFRPGGLRLVSADGGSTKVVAGLNTNWFRFSHNGSQLFAVRRGEKNRWDLSIWDVATAREVRSVALPLASSANVQGLPCRRTISG